jgi:hypothetical protein
MGAMLKRTRLGQVEVDQVKQRGPDESGPFAKRPATSGLRHPCSAPKLAASLLEPECSALL